MARDVHHVGQCLHDTGSNGAHAVLGDELDRDLGGVDLLEVVDELGQILDGVDVVVRRRRDEADAGLGVAQAGDLRRHLVPGELAALARLGALRHLDLQLVGEGEVLGCDAEATGRDLLDAAVLVVAPEPTGAEAVGVLATLAAVGHATDEVHGLRQGLVCLLREGAVRHGAGREAPGDLACGLDLVEGQRRTGGDRLEQVVQLEWRPLVDEVAERLVALVGLARDGSLQQMCGDHVAGLVVGCLLHEREVVERLHHLLGVGVLLAALADADPTGAVELRLRPGVAVTAQHVVGKVCERQTAHDRRRAAEAAVDDLRPEPHDLEELRASVRVDGGDAHLRQDLEHACFDGGLEARLRLGADEVVVVGLVGHVCDGRQGETRADGVGAVAEQAGHLVHVAGRVTHRHQARERTKLLVDEVVVDGTGGQQRRYGRPLRADVAVVEDDHTSSPAHSVGRFGGETVERGHHAGGALGHRERGVERHDRIGRAVGEVERVDTGREQEEARQGEHASGSLVLDQDRQARSQHGAQAHHPALAERVDRRVGDLREALLEVVVDRSWPSREVGERGVVAHREGGLVGVVGHGLEHHGQLLLGVAVSGLACLQVIRWLDDRVALAPGRRSPRPPIWRRARRRRGAPCRQRRR